MTIDRILSIIATMVAFVAVPASGYLSYHYAIKGEKRKEWNVLASRVRTALHSQIETMEQGVYAIDNVKKEDIYLLCDMLKQKDADNLREAYEAHVYAYTYDALRFENAVGRRMVVGDLSSTISSSKALLSMIPLK
ncbi:hypothetical protein QMN93_18960 [Enterobacter sp. R-1.6.2]|uniref:hypothetical protein n=1 Tax=unclassified Enterobacter TaxID=2608935 RepID=UPI00287C1CA3|nr:MULTISPECIES: hypothetical protein [unclassified Enterobacter]HCR2009148.1 hypothetical protein [Enterobacter asburiae]MEB2381367.1 hypothetical protein [Enterobacter sp. R-1.5.3]MEB2430383.1 hypothetical protein [Enterobacter sp. R-1.6.2]HCR2222195.1 hypothetical protein [Enterobacter asburiae]HDX3906972.1 hypothetical protein [Enterobacter asburiae]